MPEGEQGSVRSTGSTKETVFRLFFPFLLCFWGGGLEDELVEGASPSSMEPKEVSSDSSVGVG